MASLKSQGTSSPSASSIFLPLGRRSRRGSHASMSSQTERENLNEALDQIHTAACQSHSLTVFNEFTSPPASSSVSENKGLTGDLPGGLSGLYNRFRASVGGVKDIVGGSAKQSEVSSPDNITAKSPNTDTFHSKPSSASANTGPPDGFTPLTGSGQGSKLHSPVAGTFGGPADGSAHAPTVKSSKISSKTTSVSSKASVGTPAIKSPVGPLTKTTKYTAADPTVTELHVNAIKDSSIPHTRSNSGSVSTHAFPSSDSLNQERSDNIAQASKSQSSLDPASRRSHSPVLTTRPSNDPYKDGRYLPTSSRAKSSNENPSEIEKTSGQGFNRQDHNGIPELDTSFTGSSWKNQQIDDVQETVNSPQEYQTANSSKNNAPDNSNPPTARTSLSKFSNDQSSTYEGRTPTTLMTSLSLTDGDPPSSHSSRTSLKNPRDNLTTRFSQPRLPGFGISRATPTPSESTASRSTAGPQQSVSTSREAGRSGNNPPDQRWKYPASGNSGINQKNNAMSQLRSKLLSRDFWMRDENAKDCFHCGEPFTTFRRKHHCRTCGQIFDAKCTLLISGADFGSSSSIRVCKPCEAMINSRDDDSSEFSGEELSPVVFNHSTPDNGSRSQTQGDDDDTSSIVSQPFDHVMKTPTMAIPATRRAGEGNSRRSAILEFDPSDRASLRPTSSRSVKSSMSLRPHSMGHKRHHSRHQYIRSFKSYHEERAPFQRGAGEDMSRENRLSAFHRDSIIDPDLAQYLSDDASSGDEAPNLFSAVSDGALSKGGDGERTHLGGFLSAVRKGRSRIGEKGKASGLNSGRDMDDGSISSSRAVNFHRPSRRRNLSVASSVHQKLSPRASKDNTSAIPNLQDHPVPSLNLGPSYNSSGFKMTRSSSMRGAGAPALELNRASLQHVQNLLRQLLDDASIAHVKSWETALVPILLKVTDDVDPDVQRGDDMDIRHYVKLKRIPGGRPGDTSYVSGLVFTKNLALKSMPRSISRPNILIITFALEYARHEQHFMSLEPVIRQEREFLENLVSRIAALRPHLLLVEKHVSGLALQYLEKANIATAYNVKPAVLEAVSRCCQTRIITSMDKLATTPEHTGQCGSFDLKTYVHNGRKKTYMYLSGCPKELGCTIVLRGAEDDVLLKIKRIMEFMVYVVYNLKLETCLMRDEFAQIPSSTSDEITSKRDPPSSVEQPKLSNMETVRNLADNAEADGSQTTSEISKFQEHNVSEERRLSAASEGSDLPDDVPMPTFYEDMVEKQQTKILSASPFVKFMQPYLLMRARELERRLAYLKRLRDQDFSVDQAADEKSQTKKFVLITPEMIHESLAGASSKVKEVLHAVHDAEYDRALHNYQTQKRQWETYVAGNINLFDPYSHQNIVVLHSLVCTTTSIPCSGPDVFALGFYNEHESDRAFEADCTLGQYVEDLCQSANAVCTANGCEKRMLEHHRQYVHGEAQVSVFVQPYPAKMRGLQDTILMWSCCKICGNETQVMPMSDSTWKYSFGKYLELSFWSRNLHARAGVCPHDLHRDHLRYFGFKDVALRFHYDPIKLLEIIVPRPRVTWKVENDLKLKNEVYLRTEKRVNRFMSSVKARLKSINVQSVMPELAEACKQEIEILTKRANDEHAALTKQLQESYMDSRYWEVIPLNKAVRATQEKVVEWDAAFAEFEKNFFPSEKDIKRMATLQLKRIFLDKDVSVTSLTSPDEATITPAEEEVDETSPTTTEPPRKRNARRMTLSPEKAQDVLVSVVEEQSGKNNKDKIKTIEEVPSPKPKAEDRQSPYSSPPLRAASQEEVRHLDLAVPSSLSEKLSGTPPAPGIKSNASSRAPSPAPIPENKSLPNVPGAVDIPVERQANGETKSPDELVSNGESTTPSRQRSGIPRLSDGGGFRRVSNKARSPPLFRAQSQPAHLHRKNSGSSPMSAFKSGFGSSNGKQGDTIASSPGETKPKVPEKRLSDRFGLGALKTSKLTSGHSLIPRSVPGKQPNRRVSTLAKHFEQLSREFEKERFKDRQQRVAKGRQSRAYPMASSKPIVEVYKNVQDAVAEREPSIGEEPPSPMSPAAETNDIAAELAREAKPESHAMDGQTGEPTATVTPKPEDKPQQLSQSPSEVDADEYRSDEDRSLTSELHSVESPEDTAAESPEESFKLSPEEEFPKHEQSSLVKLLANFWAERSASGWKPLDYPLNVSEHVFADCDIIVREDEPSSVIAFALNSDVYKANLASIQENDQVFEKKVDPDAESNGDNQAEVEHSLLRATGTHLKYQFQEGQAKMLCKVFYAGQFDALRRKCGVSERIVESFSRCMKWDSRGGKTKSLFLKTLDERFILKSLSTIETQAFLKFAPAYFQIMSEALFHELPSAIAKMFGFYQVIIKNPVTGVEFNWFLLVMENLFYDRVPNRIFDLKGSMRNRKVQSTGERNEVLLDENMVEFIYESPLFTREHSKKLLSQSVWNDTLFLGRQNVMDYSLMIAIDESRQELVVGIIDCIRTYTWDKKLESWIKDRGFTGGGKNRPTVTSPKEYKSRFREAMARYVLHAPNCWHAIQASRIDRRPLRMEYQNGDARRDGVIENIDEPNV